MTVNKQSATQQERQQPLSLSQAFRSLPTLADLGLPVRSIMSKANSRQQDPEQKRAFLLSMLEQAIEIANDVDAYFPEESSSDNADGEQEENIRSQNQNQ
jgi:hypothetical protein